MRKYLVTYKLISDQTYTATMYGRDLCDAADRLEERIFMSKVIDVKSHPVKDGFWKSLFIWWY